MNINEGITLKAWDVVTLVSNSEYDIPENLIMVPVDDDQLCVRDYVEDQIEYDTQHNLSEIMTADEWVEAWANIGVSIIHVGRSWAHE